MLCFAAFLFVSQMTALLRHGFVRVLDLIDPAGEGSVCYSKNDTCQLEYHDIVI